MSEWFVSEVCEKLNAAVSSRSHNLTFCDRAALTFMQYAIEHHYLYTTPNIEPNGQ